MICVIEMIWTFAFIYNIFKLVALESFLQQRSVEICWIEGNVSRNHREINSAEP